MSSPSEDLSRRVKRLRLRCWRRGIREMDLLLGGYVDARADTLSEAEVAALETLIEIDDQTLFAWTSGAEDPAPEHEALIEAIRATALADRSAG